jgi:cell shape-determining protein MreC
MRQEFSHRSVGGASEGRRRLFFATLLVLVLLGADVLSGGALRATVRSAALQGHAMLRAFDSSGYFARKHELEKENASLRVALAHARAEAASASTLKSENDALRALVGVAPEGEGVSAPIVSSLGASPYGTFIVGAGSADGVEVGDIAVAAGGFVVGRVAEVTSFSAVIAAVFAPGTKTDAIIADTAVEVEGRGGFNARATMPRAIPVQEGDAVFALTYGARPVGVVGSLDSDPSRAEQVLYIDMPASLSALHYVRLVPYGR